MIKQIDARGKACPLPVIEAKRALEASPEGAKVEVLVDNEIAVQNLCKMAAQKQYQADSEKVQDGCYLVEIWINGNNSEETVENGSGKDKETEDKSQCRNKQLHRPQDMVWWWCCLPMRWARKIRFLENF